jgi:hypothetical protein
VGLDVGVGEDAHAVPDVVEDHQGVGQHQHGVREGQVVPGRRRQTLEVAGALVGQVADGASLEAGEVGQGHRPVGGQKALDELEGVGEAVLRRLTPGALHPGDAVPQGRRQPGLRPQEGVTRQAFPALHAL